MKTIGKKQNNRPHVACCQKENTALMLKEERTGTPSHCHSFSLSYFCKSPTTWDPFKDKQSSCTTCLQSIHVHITIILEGHGEAPLMASHPPSCLPPNSSPPSSSSSSHPSVRCSVCHLRQKNTGRKGGISPAFTFSMQGVMWALIQLRCCCSSASANNIM